MRQCQSFVTTPEICQAHDSKKGKHDKQGQGKNHSNKAHRDEYSSRREWGYPPRNQGPPSKIGPPRSRHAYITKEEPRTRNLRDEGNDPRFNKNRRDIFHAIRDELPVPPPTTTPSNRLNSNLLCDYHKEHGHTLLQCRQHKHIFHQLAEEGKLGKFLKQKEYGSRSDNERRPNHPRHKAPRNEERKDNSNNTHDIINMITCLFSEDYPTLRAAKESVHTSLKGLPKSTTGES